MPAAKSGSSKTASKSSVIDELIQDAENAAEGLIGHSLVIHKLEVGFVHALNGAKDDAEKALKEAEAEIAKFPALAEHGYALLKAKILAVLGAK